jgi:hypothetical protein
MIIAWDENISGLAACEVIRKRQRADLNGQDADSMIGRGRELTG